MATNRFRGIVHLTGEHDVGKTTLALSAADPSRIVMFDDDIKGRAMVEEIRDHGIEFGAYYDLTEIGHKKNEYDFHVAVMRILADVKPDQYDAIVFDTWSRFSASFHSYILKNEREFKTNWSAMGKIKGPQQWKEARRYEAEILSQMNTKAPLVIAITHLKPEYIENVRVPGKFIPDCSSVLESVPRLRLWMRHNDNGGPLPIALVLKRIQMPSLVDGVIRPTNVLPRKLVPIDGEFTLWDTIDRYMKHPIGNRIPTNDELPNSYELSILDSTLTEDQQRTFDRLLWHAAENAEEVDEEVASEIRTLFDGGMPPPLIAQRLSVELDIVKSAIKETSK